MRKLHLQQQLQETYLRKFSIMLTKRDINEKLEIE